MTIFLASRWVTHRFSSEPIPYFINHNTQITVKLICDNFQFNERFLSTMSIIHFIRKFISAV